MKLILGRGSSRSKGCEREGVRRPVWPELSEGEGGWRVEDDGEGRGHIKQGLEGLGKPWSFVLGGVGSY